jgi:3-phosphoshikimate 1-carboxyvinyltransferase
MTYRISKKGKTTTGTIALERSKSIANRILIIRALCEEHFEIQNLSTAQDTQTLLRLLAQTDHDVYDAGPAGTTFRFLTAFFAFRQGTQIMTGSDRMKQRPIAKLVDALRSLGANIEYMEQDGYPPLRIHAPNDALTTNEIEIESDVSSQYITALLMLAPTLPNGLSLSLKGNIVSRPYIEMTLSLMSYFGIESKWHENTITIAAQHYVPRDISVESDWSAASYYYAIAALSEEADIQLIGLSENSLQGDAALSEMMTEFGVTTTFNKDSIRIQKLKNALVAETFEYNFLRCPDVAQTLAVICGGLGVQGLFSGLETLKIKETDRILAIQNELGKAQVWFSALPQRFSKKKNDNTYYMLEGKAICPSPYTIATYDDHRMAMAFAPLALLGDVDIEDPKVVVKSYPDFWKDLESLGFEIREI